MSPGRRRPAAVLATAAVFALALALAFAAAAAAPARAEPLGVSWEGSWATGYVDRMAFGPENVRLQGSFSYLEASEEPADQAAITYVIVDVLGVGTEACPNARRIVPTGQRGDGPDRSPGAANQPTTTTTTPDPTSTTTTRPAVPPTASSYPFDITVSPRCNDEYRIEVRAVVDPPGDRNPVDLDGTFDPDDRLDPTISDALELEDVRVALRPPVVPGLVATLNPNRTVSLSWSVPEGYSTDDAPPDFVGYRLQRADGEADFPSAAFSLSPGTTSFLDTTLPAATPVFRYRVLAVRSGSGHPDAVAFVSSDPGTTAVQRVVIAAPPATTTTVRATPPTRAVPPATVRPGATTTVDEGFNSTLPFDDPVIGPEDAVLPEDAAGLLEIDEEPSGSGILVPFATALVVLMWALHIRHLSQRATPSA